MLMIRTKYLWNDRKVWLVSSRSCYQKPGTFWGGSIVPKEHIRTISHLVDCRLQKTEEYNPVSRRQPQMYQDQSITTRRQLFDIVVG